MPTLSNLDIPDLISNRKIGVTPERFNLECLTDRSDRTITFGARHDSHTNQYLHVYLEDGVFVSVRYVVSPGLCTLISHSSGPIMKTEDLIPAVLIIAATDREFAYKFVEKCGTELIKSFDPRDFLKLPDSGAYEAPTLKTLHKPAGYKENSTSGFASQSLF